MKTDHINDEELVRAIKSLGLRWSLYYGLLMDTFLKSEKKRKIKMRTRIESILFALKSHTIQRVKEFNKVIIY